MSTLLQACATPSASCTALPASRPSRCEPTGTGAWRVTLNVVASKARADSIGNETEVPMNDLVDIGVFAAAEKGDKGPGEPLYLQKHRVRSGRQQITVTVHGKPARAGVDPYGKLIQRETDDNLMDAKQAMRAQP